MVHASAGCQRCLPSILKRGPDQSEAVEDHAAGIRRLSEMPALYSEAWS